MLGILFLKCGRFFKCFLSKSAVDFNGVFLPVLLHPTIHPFPLTMLPQAYGFVR